MPKVVVNVDLDSDVHDKLLMMSDVLGRELDKTLELVIWWCHERAVLHDGCLAPDLRSAMASRSKTVGVNVSIDDRVHEQLLSLKATLRLPNLSETLDRAVLVFFERKKLLFGPIAEAKAKARKELQKEMPK